MIGMNVDFIDDLATRAVVDFSKFWDFCMPTEERVGHTISFERADGRGLVREAYAADG